MSIANMAQGLWLLRHLIAIVVLPLTVAVLIPLWVARRNETTLAVGVGPAPVLAQLAGAGLLAVGLVLFVASVDRFVTEGRGTLAPGPTARAGRSGTLPVRPQPDDFGRDSGVILVLFGEALVLRSGPHLL